MKLSLVQKFKHDTSGKFPGLKQLIDYLDETNIKSEESIEILEAIDECIQKMAMTSKITLEKAKQNIPNVNSPQ